MDPHVSPSSEAVDIRPHAPVARFHYRPLLMKSLRHSVGLALALFAAGALDAAAQPVYGYQVITQHPHDTGAFTQGLVLQNGRLFESTGLYGSSSLREVDLQSGAVLRSVSVSSQYFAEGMTIFQGKVFQVTWQSQT